jgi:integrase
MSLSALAVKNAKRQDLPYKLADERGLYLLVTPTGGRLWRLKYRIEGREKSLSIGAYPEISLTDARDAREEARRQLAKGLDPSAEKRASKRRARTSAADTFEAIAREWWALQLKRWSKPYADRVLARMEAELFPSLGRRPIGVITAAEILECLRKIEKRGASEIARRSHQHVSAVLRYGISTGKATRDVSADLRGALDGSPTVSHPAVTTSVELAKVLKAIDGYSGMFTVRQALLMLAHVFVRPSELRLAQWPEFDLKACTWSIPASRMKLRRPHVVPLTPPVVELLEELKEKSTSEEFVFTGQNGKRPMSDDTLSTALQRMKLGGRHTAHGFRSTASTLLHERGFDSAWIEAQLAHKVPGVKGVYMRSTFLKERSRMLEWWSSHIDGLMAAEVGDGAGSKAPEETAAEA